MLTLQLPEPVGIRLTRRAGCNRLHIPLADSQILLPYLTGQESRVQMWYRAMQCHLPPKQVAQCKRHQTAAVLGQSEEPRKAAAPCFAFATKTVFTRSSRCLCQAVWSDRDAFRNVCTSAYCVVPTSSLSAVSTLLKCEWTLKL